MICRDNDNERWSFVGHLFLWIVAAILSLGDVGDSPRQWRNDIVLQVLQGHSLCATRTDSLWVAQGMWFGGAEKGEWCAIGLLYAATFLRWSQNLPKRVYGAGVLSSLQIIGGNC